MYTVDHSVKYHSFWIIHSKLSDLWLIISDHVPLSAAIIGACPWEISACRLYGQLCSGPGLTLTYRLLTWRCSPIGLLERRNGTNFLCYNSIKDFNRWEITANVSKSMILCPHHQHHHHRRRRRRRHRRRRRRRHHHHHHHPESWRISKMEGKPTCDSLPETNITPEK